MNTEFGTDDNSEQFKLHFTDTHKKKRIIIRTKTKRRTDREQYTRSNAVTARLLTLVKPAET